MENFEQKPDRTSRANELRAEIASLRITKDVNVSDPAFAAEIQEEIEYREKKLKEIESE